MKFLKSLIKKLQEKINWSLVLILSTFLKKNNIKDSILLVPAGDLNGGFGEDIMVTSFIANFAIGKKVSILTYKVIKRDDYLGKFPGISYIGGFRERNYLKLLNIIRNHSQVYVLGADIMDGTYGYYLSVDRLRILQLANKMGIDAQISGFSVSNKILPEVKEELTKTSEFTFIKSRDIDSYKRITDFIPAEKALLTNDIAFICPDIPETYESAIYKTYKDWIDAARTKGKKIIGFCPNSIQAKKIGLAKYIKDSCSLIDNFLKEDNYSIVFLYHDIRPLLGNESDRTIAEQLFNNYKDSNTFFTDKINNGVSLKGYLKHVDFTITGRMHLGISGLTYGKPMFGVCYANKFEGMVRLFETNPDDCLVDFEKMDENINVITRFRSKYSEIKAAAEKNISIVVNDTLKNFQ